MSKVHVIQIIIWHGKLFLQSLSSHAFIHFFTSFIFFIFSSHFALLSSSVISVQSFFPPIFFFFFPPFFPPQAFLQSLSPSGQASLHSFIFSIFAIFSSHFSFLFSSV